MRPVELPKYDDQSTTSRHQHIPLLLLATGSICLLVGCLIGMLIHGSATTANERQDAARSEIKDEQRQTSPHENILHAPVAEMRPKTQLSRSIAKIAPLNASDERSTKVLSGKVDGKEFSFDSLHWRLIDSNLQVTGDMLNETGTDWYSAAFQVSLNDASNRNLGTTWFHMANLNADSTVAFTASVSDFQGDPNDIQIKIHFQTGLNIDQVKPGFRHWTSNDDSIDIEAKVVDFQDGLVWLERPDGKRIKVKLDLLSTTNKALAKQWILENENPTFHLFTSDSGSLSMQAKVVGVEDGVVTLERPNGEQGKYKLEFLSEAGRARVEKWVAENQKR